MGAKFDGEKPVFSTRAVTAANSADNRSFGPDTTSAAPPAKQRLGYKLQLGVSRVTIARCVPAGGFRTAVPPRVDCAAGLRRHNCRFAGARSG